MYNTSAESPPLLLRSLLYSLLLELGSVADVASTGSHLSNQTTVTGLGGPSQPPATPPIMMKQLVNPFPPPQVPVS